MKEKKCFSSSSSSFLGRSCVQCLRWRAIILAASASQFLCEREPNSSVAKQPELEKERRRRRRRAEMSLI